MQALGRKCSALLFAVVAFADCGGGPPKDSTSRRRLLDHVRMLSQEIGPRPTGSAGDVRARQYILQNLQEAGLAAREEPIQAVRLSDTADLFIDSANVVGVMEGKRPGAILVGAHHDSRNSLCPGASDDASGVAVLLETARRLAAGTHRHTLVFASFTGEEALGLPGSREFARRWKGPPLLAAITLDFVGTGKVFVAPFPRPPELWANRLLARAEAGARTNRVLFDPWLAIVPRLLPLPYGADHISFQAIGIPAFNLSCQFPAWTYHTPEDVPARIEGATLEASLELVSRMVRALDAEPSLSAARDIGYLPLEIGGRAFFAADWVLRLAGVVIVCLAGWRIAMHRSDIFRWQRWVEGLWVLLTAVPFSALAVSGGFAMEALLAHRAQVRHPWTSHPASHLTGALVATAATLWIATGAYRFLRPSTRPGCFLAMGVLVQGIEAGALTVAGRHDVAFPLWLGMAGMLAASCCASVARRVGWGALGIFWSLPFLSATAYRMFVELSGASLPPFALEGAVLALAIPWFLFIEHLACLPEVLLDRRPLRIWSPGVGLCLALATLGLGLFNANRPSYDPNHRVLVQVWQSVDISLERVEAVFSSPESLRVVRAPGWSSIPLPDATRTSLSIPWDRIRSPDLSVESEKKSDEEVLRLRGMLSPSPRLASLTVRATRPFQVLRGETWESSVDYCKQFLPDSGEILGEIHVRREGGEPLQFEAEVSSDNDLLGLIPSAPDRVFRFSSSVRLSGRIP